MLAALLAAFSLLDVFLSGDWLGPVAVNALVVPAAALSLTWRRTRPLASLAAVVACLCGLGIAFGAGETWASVFI